MMELKPTYRPLQFRMLYKKSPAQSGVEFAKIALQCRSIVLFCSAHSKLATNIAIHIKL